jgi:hypothetical protein
MRPPTSGGSPPWSAAIPGLGARRGPGSPDLASHRRVARPATVLPTGCP